MQLIVEQAAARCIGLPPLAVNDHLRDGALAYVPDDLLKGLRIFLDIDFGIRNAVQLEEFLGGAAVAAPFSRVDFDLHIQNCNLRGL